MRWKLQCLLACSRERFMFYDKLKFFVSFHCFGLFHLSCTFINHINISKRYKFFIGTLFQTHWKRFIYYKVNNQLSYFNFKYSVNLIKTLSLFHVNPIKFTNLKFNYVSKYNPFILVVEFTLCSKKFAKFCHI